MKIETEYIPEMTIEEFADQHGLVMIVRERAVDIGASHRYYARFQNVEVEENGLLASESGDGSTPAEAIVAYGHAISLRRIRNGTEGDVRINVPRLVETKETP